MHPYYEKNKDKLKKQLEGFLAPIAPELEKDLELPYEKILEETWQCYESRMLENFPYIGGDKISGTRNLTGAYVFVALGEVCREKGMTLERWGWLTTQAYRRYFEKLPGFLRGLPRKLLGAPGLVNRMLKKKDRINARNAAENPGSFETKVQEPTEEYPIIYHTTVCPLYGFARDHGYMDYMPYLCNLDYVTFEFFGVPFYREKTCAAGDGFCDFKMKRGAPVNPSWPCHGLHPWDPLK